MKPAKLAASVQNVTNILPWLQGPAQAGNLGVPWRVKGYGAVPCDAVKAQSLLLRQLVPTVQLLLLQQLAQELSQQLDVAADAASKQLADHKSFDVSTSCLSVRSSSLQPAWPHLPLPKLRLDSNTRVHEGSEGRLLALAERVGCSAAGLCSRCSCGLLHMSRHSSSKRCLPTLDSPLLRYQPVRVATIPVSLCHV